MEGGSGGGGGSGGCGSSWQDLFQALIKAKTKNILEEIKLQRELDMLEVERQHMDKMHFNIIFEQKKAVYRVRLETLLMKLRAQEKGCNSNAVLISAMEEISSRGPPGEDSGDRSGYDWGTLPMVTDRERGIQDNKVVESTLDGHKRDRHKKDRRGQHGRGEDVAKAIESILKLERGEREAAPCKPAQVEQTGRAAPHKAHGQAKKATEPIDQKGSKKKQKGSRNIYVGGHWVGDPKAIASVRRARKPPEELVARHRHRAVGEIRRLYDDMPGLTDCSRHCQRQVRVDRVQAMSRSLPPILLNATQLNILKRKAAAAAAAAEEDSYYVPWTPGKRLAMPPACTITTLDEDSDEDGEVPHTVASQKKEEIKEKIKRLEKAAKADQVNGHFERSPRNTPKTAGDDGTKSLLDDVSKVRVGGGYSQRYN